MHGFLPRSPEGVPQPHLGPAASLAFIHVALPPSLNQATYIEALLGSRQIPYSALV